MAEIANGSIFSQTDSANSGSLPGITGSSSPALIDNSIQALMGAIKREHDWRNYTVTSSGSANAYVLTYSVAPAAYYTGQRFSFTTNFAVTGSATVNVNTLGAKTIKKIVSGVKTNLASGDIASGDFIDLVYDGTDMVWTNKGTASAPSGSITSSGYTQSTARMLGRSTASTGAIEEISVGAGLALSAGSIATSGAITSSGFTQSTSRLLGRTTASTGAVEEISVGTGLTLSGGSLTATGGGMTLIQTLTGTGVSTQSVTGISSTYRQLYIEIEGVSSDTGSTWTLRVAVSANNGSSYGTAVAIGTSGLQPTVTSSGTVTITGIQLSLTTTFGAPVYPYVVNSNSTEYNTIVSAKPATSGSINAIQFFVSSGNFDAGTIRVYGVS